MRAIVALIFLSIASSSMATTESPALRSELGAARQSYVRGKWDEALATLDRSDKAAGATMESLDLRGCIYLEQGKFDDAAKAFEDSHDANFTAFAPRIHLGDVLLREKKFQEARKQYEKLLEEVKAPMWPEALRFGVLLTYLGEHDDAGARQALGEIAFPTETPAYYCAQAAWSFAHGHKSDGLKWMDTAAKIYKPEDMSWFARGLHQFGWLKKKPALAIDPFF